MPTISRFYGITIRMYYADHEPAHFHAVYGEFEATVEIETLEVLEGRMPRRALELIRDWTEIHQAELIANWKRCRAAQTPWQIEPLR